jgi:hypothetical protein
MKKISLEWLNSAKDDLLIITKIIDDVSLTHQVAFHAQQAIENSGIYKFIYRNSDNKKIRPTLY